MNTSTKIARFFVVVEIILM